MFSVRIELIEGGPITFDCEEFDMNVANAFLADHSDDNTFAIHGFDNIVGELPGNSHIANGGTSLILQRSDVLSIEVV